jgi:hypothetical protein
MNDSLSRRRQRVQLIRGRVVAGSIALFVAVFGGITAQLASGHDPALSTSSTTTTAKSTKTRTTTTQPQQQTTQQQHQSTSVSPVTTRQS